MGKMEDKAMQTGEEYVAAAMRYMNIQQAADDAAESYNRLLQLGQDGSVSYIMAGALDNDVPQAKADLIRAEAKLKDVGLTW